jgi:hypothetical protein
MQLHMWKLQIFEKNNRKIEKLFLPGAEIALEREGANVWSWIGNQM